MGQLSKWNPRLKKEEDEEEEEEKEEEEEEQEEKEEEEKPQYSRGTGLRIWSPLLWHRDETFCLPVLTVETFQISVVILAQP